MPTSRIRSSARNGSAVQLPTSPSMVMADLAMTMSAKWLRPAVSCTVMRSPTIRSTGGSRHLARTAAEVHVPQLEEVAERRRHRDPPLDLRRHPGDKPIILGVTGNQAEAALSVVLDKRRRRTEAPGERIASRHSRSSVSSSGSEYPPPVTSER